MLYKWYLRRKRTVGQTLAFQEVLADLKSRLSFFLCKDDNQNLDQSLGINNFESINDLFTTFQFPQKNLPFSFSSTFPI